MRASLPLIASLLLASGCSRPGSVGGAPSGTGDLVIRRVTVVDVAQGALLADRTVLVRGRRIVAVASEEVATSAGATVVDGTGRYLIPGLWDMHVHTTDPVSLAHSVAHGVTGVRDMGGGAEQPTDGCESVHLDSLLAWRARITSGHRAGPLRRFARPGWIS